MTGSTSTSDGATPDAVRPALRAARAEHGWSQAEAARALRELAGRRAGPDATAASLKTQISRWENGHALPDPEYRALLAELYGRPPEQLGLLPTTPPGTSTGAERLRAELAGAAAVDDPVLGLWTIQLDTARRIDDELGTAGAGEVVAALTDRLTRLLRHTPSRERRPAVAAVLSGAAELAGRQALDAADPERAWRLLDTAEAAAREAASPDRLVAALAGQAAVLRAVGTATAAVEVLDRAGTGPIPAAARTRLAAARGMAHAAAGDPTAAHLALDDAARYRPGIDVTHPGEVAVELADLHRWHGRALLDLGDPGASDRLESALAAEPRRVRHRAGLHADLALALAGTDGDAAAGHARRARALAERISSRQVADRLTGGVR